MTVTCSHMYRILFFPVLAYTKALDCVDPTFFLGFFWIHVYG